MNLTQWLNAPVSPRMQNVAEIVNISIFIFWMLSAVVFGAYGYIERSFLCLIIAKVWTR